MFRVLVISNSSRLCIGFCVECNFKTQDEIEEEGTLSKFKLKTFDANEKVKDAKLEKLKEEMGLDDTGNFIFSNYQCFL